MAWLPLTSTIVEFARLAMARCDRWDHLILCDHQVPTRLDPPRRFADRTAEGAQAQWDLGIGHERGGLRVHVSRERGTELRLVEEQIPVLRRQNRRHGRARRRIFDERGHGLAPVGGKSWAVTQRP